MRCEELRATIDLEDGGRRPAPRALRAHLERCPACAARHAEVLWILRAGAGGQRIAHGGRRLRRGAAAAALLIVLALSWAAARRTPLERPDAAKAPPIVAVSTPPPPRARLRLRGAGALEHGIVRQRRLLSERSNVTFGVVRPAGRLGGAAR
jgi:hypothetical protein